MLLLALLLVLGAGSMTSVSAQTSELAVEVGGSRMLPPSGVDGAAADYLVGGLRAVRYDVLGTGGHASLLFGRSMDGNTGGDFISGEVGGSLWQRLGAGWSTGLEGSLVAFRVADPFSYQAAAAEASATLRWRVAPFDLSLAGTAGAGRSRTEISSVVQRMRRQFTVRQVLQDDLWRYGATLEALVGGPSVAGGVAGGLHRSHGGVYRSAGLRFVAGGGRGALEVRGDVWTTPNGGLTTGSIAFYVPWGAWHARGTAGRPEPDPLFLAEPSRGTGGVLAGRRILGSGPSLRARTSLHRVIAETADGVRVRFTLNAPAGAVRVDVLGDFTLWRPVAMTRDGGRWTADVHMAPGTWHFGFLVDGEWYVPEETPDVVPDEWGQRSATLVVEGAGS